MRLGIAASANLETMAALRKHMAIWNINSFAEFYLQIYSKYDADYQHACLRFAEERENFYQELQSIDFLRVIPSQANYFLCEVTQRYTSTQLVEKLLKQNVLLKDCSTKKGFDGKSYIRIAIRDRKDNHQLFELLQSC